MSMTQDDARSWVHRRLRWEAWLDGLRGPGEERRSPMVKRSAQDE